MSLSSPGLITVFGGAGFVGTQVVRALAQRGWRVRVACRKPARAWKLQTAGRVGQIQAVRCDIADPAMVTAALEGADAAVNLVGLLYESGAQSFDRIQVEGARTIAEQARKAGATQLVHVSAIGADANGASDYARTKAEGEAAVKKAFPNAAIVRPSVIFGQGDGLFERFAKLAAFAPALPLIGNGETRLQPVWVGDVAEAIARAVEAPDAAGQTYELGGPAVMTLGDVIRRTLSETHQARALLPVPFFAARGLGTALGLSRFVGIAPMLTADQVTLLETDNVVSPGAAGLADLGIQPTGVDAITPSYLWRYRKGGQFAEAQAA